MSGPAQPRRLRHGGDLAEAALRFPAAPAPWLDLSTGISPFAYPLPPLDPGCWARLPAGEGLIGLEQAAGQAYAAPPQAVVVAAHGTQALLQALVRRVPARRIAVLGFGYAEHPAVWRAAGASVEITDDLGQLEDAQVAVVVNPNNPDGRTTPPAALGDLGRRMARRGGLLVVDEAFCDAADPALSLVPGLPAEGTLVLRSFGKTYGLAGLRLAFAVTSPGLGEALRAELGPWPVSGPAIAVGTRALSDAVWRMTTLARLRRAVADLDAVLAGANLPVRGGTWLFRLVETPAAAAVFAALGRAGILVRAFAERPDWLRFGIPAGAAELARLRAALP